MPVTRAPFQTRLKAALDSPSLELALERALTSFRERRAASFQPGEFETLRDELRGRKDRFLERLPELVDQFTREAEQAGAVVHRARDAEEACRIIAGLARERGVKLAVKTKSMATEEIGLNEHLEHEGVRVVETDLGEWIIQLAHEHPTHLIAPAIHKTREDVAALFSRYTGQELPPDIRELVNVARRELRQLFIDAQMGITGANIGIAESGTIVLVTNEGNADMVTTLPPVHVAVMGVEKIVPGLDDAALILKLLPRSATGQRLSSYTNFITGPSRTGDIELSMTTGVHGPKEVHIVLLDNGRWELRDDPDLHDALRCIRCGACANVCPPYQAVGGQAMGYVYAGPIGLILTAQHHGLEHAAGPQGLCAGCNACEGICPAGIPLPRLIMGVRQRAVAQKGMPWTKRTALNAFGNRPLFERGLGLARLAQVLRLPTPRSLPSLPARNLYQRYGKRTPLPPHPALDGGPISGRQVGLFCGCVTNLAYPEMGEAVAGVLERMGARVTFPQEQWCCGLALMNAGDRDGAKPQARQTIEMLEAVPGEVVVSNSASCVVAVQQDYQDLFKDEPVWRQRAAAAGKRLMDFTSFVDRYLKVGRPLPEPTVYPERSRREGRGAVTYHDSCQSYNCLGLKPEARRVLKDALGIEVTEMQDSHVCCGFGGSFSIDYPEVSARVLRRKLNNIEATGASTVVTDNPGCILHLRGGLRGKSVRVLHLAEILAEALQQSPLP